MMYDLDKPDKMMKYIDKLKTTSRHLLDMLSDVLDISKIEKGAYELRKQPVDILEQVRLVSEVIKPQSQEKNQIFEVSAEKITHPLVMGDDVRIRQVLINLLSNAVKYTQEIGNIRLEVIEKDTDGAGRAVYQITVEDNGMGMSEDFQSHIFEPFSRSDESVNKKIHGTGLGMAITKKFVDLMGGKISLKSRLGQGSRFDLTIPFVIDNKTEEFDPAGNPMQKKYQ